MPRSGPTKAEITKSSTLKEGSAFIVEVNSRVIQATSETPVFGFSSSFLNAGVMDSDLIASGDILSLTVFENVVDEPLLGNTGQRISALTEIQVDGQGYIFVPYVGKVEAAGQSTDALREFITKKLESQTPNPQVQIQKQAGDGATVTVSGFAGAQGIYPIERSTSSLMSMLAKAGGVQIEPETAIIHLTRKGETGKIWATSLYSSPALDIALRPNDIISIERDNRAFTALGATGSQNRVPFESEKLTAMEGLAMVGGLNTSTADPTGIFIFRSESAEIANAVLGRSDLQGDQRIVYTLDLTQPMGIFDARDFLIRDGDTIYVTEAPYVQWSKTLGALTGTSSAASALADTANGN